MGYQNGWNYRGNVQKPEEKFMESYVQNFDFEKSLSLESFEEKQEFWKISSNTGLRKIYDAYLDKVKNESNNQNIQINVRFAKIGYQEKRKLLPQGFLKFLEWIWKKIPGNEKEKYENFRIFLEVFLSYHKYFNPNAK